MCGIVGYIGGREAAGLIMNGLARLEYRGYDSAGLVVRDASATPCNLQLVKRAGKLNALRNALDGVGLPGTLGFGHTRWATHGAPTDANSHPHSSEDGQLALIHNGIIENHQQLREELITRGHTFSSATDSEVLVHLIEEQLEVAPDDLVGAVRAALKQVEGAYAVVVAHADFELLVAARQTSPLVLGLGDGENFLASDVTALLPHSKRVIYLLDGDVVELDRDGARISGLDGMARKRPVEVVEWSAEAAEKDGYEHHMLKEIYEQPHVVRQALLAGLNPSGSDVNLDLGFDPRDINRVVITAAGTAAYAGEVGKVLITRLARLGCSVEVASEFRYSEPVLGSGTLCVVVSQSGETIDTLEALREAKRRGAHTLALLNVRGSSISREADDVLYLGAGPEIGVASTKAYTAMLVSFTLLALWLAQGREAIDEAASSVLVASLRELPVQLERVLERRVEVAAVADELLTARSVLFLGRGVNYAAALEGALKLKEISYLHAEAYPAGELKHGPIALIEEGLPVVVIATASATLAKTVSSIQEVRARHGKVIALVNDHDSEAGKQAQLLLRVPRTTELLSPLINAVPLQLLAYEVASRLGREVDQPRNLAKSVTVE